MFCVVRMGLPDFLCLPQRQIDVVVDCLEVLSAAGLKGGWRKAAPSPTAAPNLPSPATPAAALLESSLFGIMSAPPTACTGAAAALHALARLVSSYPSKQSLGVCMRER